MSYTTKHVVEEVTADDIIQEHKEQEIVQQCIDADSTDDEIEVVILMVEAGANAQQIRAALSQYHGKKWTN